MSTTKKPEQEHTEASPPTPPTPPKPPAAPAQGDMPSINEPPSPADDGHEKSPQVTDVSRETDHGNKRHR